MLLYTARVAGGPQAFDGVIGGTSYYWGLESSIPSAKAFNDRYRKAYDGKVPSDYGALGYAGVRAVLTAVKEAGTTETEKVVDTLQSLKYDFYKGPERLPRLRSPGGAVRVHHPEQEQGHGQPVRRVRCRLDRPGRASPAEDLRRGRPQLNAAQVDGLTPELIALQAFTGLALGAIYVLLALGMSLVFGMLTVVNFAHGAFYMLGAYAGLVRCWGSGGISGSAWCWRRSRSA